MGKSYKSLELPDSKKCMTAMKQAFDKPYAPSHIPEQTSKKYTHPHRAMGLRTAQHKGHKIEITTTYEIKIDGKPFKGHVMVDDKGHLHCHSIPYETYGSAVNFVKSVIDIYPDSFCKTTAGGNDHE